MKNRLLSSLVITFLHIASGVCWAVSCSDAQQSAPPKNSKKILLLRGKDIKSLPMKRAGKGLKMINLKTAEKLGISIPEEIIKTAYKVIR